MADIYHGPIHDHWPAERAHVEDGYRALPFPYAELPPPDLAIEVDWPLDRLVGYIGTWSATAAYRKAVGADPIPEVEARLAAVWGPPQEARRFRFPLAIRAGRGPA